MVWLGQLPPNPPRKKGTKRLVQEQTNRTAIRSAAGILLADPLLGVTRRKASLAAGRSPRTARRLYPSDDALHGDILTEHIKRLAEAVTGVAEAGQPADPAVRLESITKAWLDFVDTEPNEHRAFLLCGPTLKEPHRTQARTGYLRALDIVRDAVCTVIPGLGDLFESLLGPTAAVLGNAALRPPVTGTKARQQEARRVAGMLVGAGITEVSGGWNRLLPPPKPRTPKK